MKRTAQIFVLVAVDDDNDDMTIFVTVDWKNSWHHFAFFTALAGPNLGKLVVSLQVPNAGGAQGLVFQNQKWPPKPSRSLPLKVDPKIGRSNGITWEFVRNTRPRLLWTAAAWVLTATSDDVPEHHFSTPDCWFIAGNKGTERVRDCPKSQHVCTRVSARTQVWGLPDNCF